MCSYKFEANRQSDRTRPWNKWQMAVKDLGIVGRVKSQVDLQPKFDRPVDTILCWFHYIWHQSLFLVRKNNGHCVFKIKRPFSQK